MMPGERIDLGPATSALQALVAGVRDDQLALPTPCENTTVGAMLDHVDSFSIAFTAAAKKTRLPGTHRPVPDASHLGDDWKQRIRQRLAELAEAWRSPDAWTGVTEAGGQQLPGETAGVIALNEVLVHTWDISKATGQDVEEDPALVDAALGFVAPIAESSPEGTPGLFGPPIPVPENSPLIDRLICLTGRNPRWSSPEG
jgi:uncharacterized protein (TIGR03086 family)